MRIHQFSNLATSFMIGLLVALVMLAIFPQLRNSNQNPSETQHSNFPHPTRPAAISYSEAVSKAAPSVVNIYTRGVKILDKQKRWDPQFGTFTIVKKKPYEALGSGVIMRKDGVILTNHHLLEGAGDVAVMLNDGREAPVSLIGIDVETDLAVLKLDMQEVKPIGIAASENAMIGDVVLAIGNPHGVGQTVTHGIISAKGVTDVNSKNPLQSYLQTDAAINRGNSGGALIDHQGKLLGINTFIDRKLGSVSFAIPSERALQTMEEILAGRGWLGFNAISITMEMAKQKNVPIGLLIRAVSPGGPAERSKLMPGDIITALDDAPIADPQTIMTQIAKSQPGTPIKLKVWRQGRLLRITARVGTRPK